MIPKSECPHCKKILWDPVERPADITMAYFICIYCGEPSKFNKSLKLTKIKDVPKDVLESSAIAKLALAMGFNFELWIKNELVREGKVKEH